MQNAVLSACLQEKSTNLVILSETKDLKTRDHRILRSFADAQDDKEYLLSAKY